MRLLNELYNIPNKIKVNGIEMDSRKVKPGYVFVCIKGAHVDGHDFVQSAVKNGAVAIISERPLDIDCLVIQVENTDKELARISHWFYQYPAKQMKMIGITGTNGKTTTTNVIKHIINNNVGYIGTNGYSYNGKHFETKNTTPDSLRLAQIFDEMVNDNVNFVSMEVSSRALDMHRVHQIDFDIAGFTNLTHEHLDEHHSMENYLHSKARLFYELSSNKIAILNADDLASVNYLKQLTKAKVLSYGIKNEADYKVNNLEVKTNGTNFDIVYEGNTYNISIPLLGVFNVYNCALAFSITHQLGFELDYIIDRLKTIPVIDGRMEVIDEGQDYTVIVDYAHTPDGLEKVLEYAKQIANKDIKLVVGCAGSRDRYKRPLMAKISCDNVPRPIFTTDDPHAEDPVDILKEMETGVQGRTYDIVVDRKEAIRKAIKEANEGDVIIIAGRGHELIQYWSSGNILLDDREEVRKAIKEFN